MNKYLNMNSKVIVVPIVLSLLFASINLSPSLFLGCFIFVSYVTLTPLRRSCCILGGLRGIPWINLLGQWLSHLKKLNCICDFLLQQQQSKRFISWLNSQNLSTMSTLPTSCHRLQPLPSCCLTSQKLRSSLAKTSVASKNAFIPCWTCMELSSLFLLPNLMHCQCRSTSTMASSQ